MKIGILRESSKPNDRRTAIVPKDIKELLACYNNMEFFVQPSPVRIFTEKEYENAGAIIREDLSECDYLFGVKEVLPEKLIPNMHYFFFAHIGKGQSYHQHYISQLQANKITLTDYEYLVNKTGKRVAAFGHWAGIIGVYYALMAIGKKYEVFNLPTPKSFSNYLELLEALKVIKLPTINILITGNGNAAKGAIELLEHINIKKLSPFDYKNNTCKNAVYTQLEPENYVQHQQGKTYQRKHFFTAPSEYESSFSPYLKQTDVFIPCHYWHPDSPNFFTLNNLKENNFKTKIVADITCDLNGPIPTTIRSSSFIDPFYDYNITQQKEEPAFSSSKNITVMAIDNLPAALPGESSTYFSKQIRNHVIENLLNRDENKMIKEASLIRNGKLTKHFPYIK